MDEQRNRPQCAACLDDASQLTAAGVCADRQACEARARPLFGLPVPPDMRAG